MSISEKLINFVIDSAPKRSWEMGRVTLSKIRRLTDDEGRYLWQPSFSNGESATMLDIPIIIVKEECLRLKFKFSDGDEKFIEYDVGDFKV